MVRFVFAAGLILASCATTGRYTGNTFYYSDAGAVWSCREPEPWRGGNCRPDGQWPDGGLHGHAR